MIKLTDEILNVFHMKAFEPCLDANIFSNYEEYTCICGYYYYFKRGEYCCDNEKIYYLLYEVEYEVELEQISNDDSIESDEDSTAYVLIRFLPKYDCHEILAVDEHAVIDSEHQNNLLNVKTHKQLDVFLN